VREDESARIAASDHGANIRANPATDIVLKEFQQRQKRVRGGRRCMNLCGAGAHH
jgi:hypothetical protein